jgi:hypothetical protein
MSIPGIAPSVLPTCRAEHEGRAASQRTLTGAPRRSVGRAALVARTMRVETPAPFLQILNGKRQSFPGEWCRKLRTHRTHRHEDRGVLAAHLEVARVGTYEGGAVILPHPVLVYSMRIPRSKIPYRDRK